MSLAWHSFLSGRAQVQHIKGLRRVGAYLIAATGTHGGEI